MTAVAALVEAVRDVVDATLRRPVREGRPHPGTWPTGLVAVAVATAVLYVVIAVAAAAAQWLRVADVLLVSPLTGITLPALSVPLLLGGLVWSMVLLHVAALHTTWWLRLALAIVGVIAVALFGAQAWGQGWPLFVSGGLYVLLGVFALVRSRRSSAWWEFPLVGAWMVLVLYLPWLTSGYGAMFGVDHRLAAVQGTLETLQVLSVPALLVAGCAPAMITVTAGESMATRPLPQWLAVGLILAVAAWRIADVAWSMSQGAAALVAPNVVAAAITLAAMMGLAAGLRRLSDRVSLPGPGALPEIWAAYIWPLAMCIGWLVLLSVPVSIVRVLAAGSPFAQRVLEPFWRLFERQGPQTIRLLIGVVAVVVAWRLARRRQVAGAVLLTSFFVYSVVQRIGPVSGLRVVGAQTPEALAAVSSALALVLLAGFAAAGKLTRRRASGLAIALVLGALYPHRNAFDDPIGALLGFAGLGVLLFGLIWQTLTNGDYTDGDSSAFPRSTRVLLYLANALFAVTGAALLSLSRESGGVDATDWTELGDELLGTPLFVAGIVAGLWLAVGRQPSPPPAAPARAEETSPSQPGPWAPVAGRRPVPPPWPAAAPSLPPPPGPASNAGPPPRT